MKLVSIHSYIDISRLYSSYHPSANITKIPIAIQPFLRFQAILSLALFGAVALAEPSYGGYGYSYGYRPYGYGYGYGHGYGYHKREAEPSYGYAPYAPYAHVYAPYAHAVSHQYTHTPYASTGLHQVHGVHKREAEAEASHGYGYGYAPYGYGYAPYGYRSYGYHKRSADAEPSHAPYAPALAYHPYHGVSYTHRSPQGLGKREAEAEPSYGYGRGYGYGHGYGYHG